MLKAKDGEFFNSGWLRNRTIVESLGIWESAITPVSNMADSPQLEARPV